MSKNLSELSGRKGVEENLFDKMGKLAVDTGAPSKEQLEELAEEFLIGKSTTYGTTTFYDFLSPKTRERRFMSATDLPFALARSRKLLNN